MIAYSYYDVLFMPDLISKMIEFINKHSINQEPEGYFGGLLKDRVAILEMKFLYELCLMENRGIPINRQYLVDKLNALRAEKSQALDQGNFDKDFNPISPKQILEYVKDRGEIIESSDATHLKEVKHIEGIPEIMTIKKASKEIQMIEDYLYKWQEDDRIYSSFFQIKASTGRMSSSNPNMQQIPRTLKKGIYGNQKGYKVVTADYPSIEARIAGTVTQDPEIIKVFVEGKDLHYLTASIVTRKPISEITDLERMNAKAINFGFIYGMGARSFKIYAYNTFELEVTLEEAERYRKVYLDTYKGVKRYHMKNNELLKMYNGKFIAHTIYGRRMLVDKFTNANNFPVQGSGSDMLKMAVVMFNKTARKKGLDAHAISVVHDEIVTEIHESCLSEGEQLLKDSMSYAANLMMPEFTTNIETKIY
jgi:DNA polymerase-1